MQIEPAPSGDPFQRIRDACRTVAEQAAHVRIRTERVAPYARGLLADGIDVPALDIECHFRDGEEETVAYYLTLAAINFGSGYFPYLAKRPGMSGYYTIACGLTERFRTGGPIPAAMLSKITPRECARLFDQDMRSSPIRELMTLFARALRGLGAQVECRFGGRFGELVGSAGRSAGRLIEILCAQPFFRDTPPYRDFHVPLYKRAQLLASDLALAFAGEGPGRFDDLDRLTIFADNLVPHVLRVDGLLEYSEPLAAVIDRDELIRAGSDMEIEIRASAVHCAELIRESTERRQRSLCSRQLDQILWHRGQRSKYKSAKRHRTRTVFY